MDDSRYSDPVAELFGELSERVRGDRWQPAVDVYETGDAIVVQLELAGVRREDVRITVDRDLLRIRGVRSTDREAGIQRLHQIEIAQGAFERVLRVSIPFDSRGVTAVLEEGFLRVCLPKQGPRRIEVGS